MKAVTIDATGTLWEAVRFKTGECRQWQVGPLDLRVRRTEHEWHVFSSRESDRESALTAGAEGEMPAESAYRRFAADAGHDTIKLVPVFPDRPVVAKPDLNIAIPPGGEALFFAGVPAWFRVISCGKREFTLADEPSAVLSNTWFGAPTEGELCYALQTRASRDAENLKTGLWRVVCPVSVRNKSEEVLEFQRLCLRVKHVSIYWCREHGRLWGTQCTVRYLSEEKTSEIEYSSKAPPFEEGLQLLQKAQEKPAKGGFIARTFGIARATADFD